MGKDSFLFWQKGNFILVGRRNTIFTEHTENIIFPCIFWERSSFIFCTQKNISYFREKEMPSFLMIEEWSYSSTIFLERPSFQNIWRIYHISLYFLSKIIFYFSPIEQDYILGERNIIFPDYTRKIIFQFTFFGKTIFSEHLEKEKYGFLCSL